MSQLNPPLTKEDFTKTSWQDVVERSESQHCFKYSSNFFKKAQELGNLREKYVYQALGLATGGVVNEEETLEEKDQRFNCIFTNVIDNYLNLDLLSEITLETSAPELQARLADILWIGTSKYEMAHLAISAYLKSAIILKSEKGRFFQRTERALYLARKTQYQIEDIVGHIAEFLNDHPEELLEEKWRKLLQDYKLQINYAERVEKAAKSAESAESFFQWELAEEYWKAKADWHYIEKDYTNQSIALRASYYAEIEEQIQKAKACIRSENPQEFINSCYEYEKAIEAFEKIKGIKEEISETESRHEEINKRLKDLNHDIENLKQDSLMSTAFHETGHAFIHEIFELSYIDMEISFENGGTLNSQYALEIENTCNLLLIDRLFYACICFAGVISENEYKRVNYTDKNFSESFKGGGECDWKNYQYICCFQDSWVIPLRDITRKIIAGNWELVSKIANELFKEKKMKSEEVKQLLGDCGLKEQQNRYILELERISQEVINKE